MSLKYKTATSDDVVSKVDPKETRARYLYIVQDFYIELLGAFIPGFLFLSTISFVVCYFYYFATLGRFPLSGRLTFLSSHFGVCLFFGCLSYAFGAVFYRMPPKKVDSISCFRQWVRSPIEEKTRLSVQYGPADTSYCDEERNAFERSFRRIMGYNFISYAFFYKIPEHVMWKLLHKREKSNPRIKFDYPYPHLRIYLKIRQFSDLLKFAAWCPFSTAGIAARSKHRINMLKQIIKTCGDIDMKLDLVRNEGQIRLISSLWYVMKILRSVINWALVLGLVVLIVRLTLACIGSEVFEESISSGVGFGAFLFYFLVLSIVQALFTLVKWHVEESIHYVRNREILAILGYANILYGKVPSVFPKYLVNDGKDVCCGCNHCATFNTQEKGGCNVQ